MQALADFIAEFTYANTTEVAGMTNGIEATKVVEARDKKNFAPTQEDTQQWTLYVDGASNENGSGAGMMLISPERDKIHCVLHFGFQVSNNKVEYEALIAGLYLPNELQACNVKVYSDSHW